MKQQFILFFLLLSGIIHAQQNASLKTAIQHLQQKSASWQLKKSDVEDMLISSEVTTEKGITYLYLNQAFQNIPIRNAMATIIIKDGQVVSDQNNLISDVASKINASSKKLNADQAILDAARYLGVEVKGKPVMSNRTNEGKLIYSFPDLAKSPISAELKYELSEDKLILVWNLSIDMKNSADYWDINMDANTGTYISKHNFTVYCQHHHDQYARHDQCAIRTFRKISDNTQSVNAILNGSTAAKYNVFALPAESPIHGGRKIVTDDQYPDMSPFGWHDTDGKAGAEFTITRGNNVYAYQDKNDDDAADGTPTDGGASLNFDFPMDFAKDPRESADAAVTNLFYLVNMMHDVSAKVGFTEEFGNFQETNYSGKADGRDYVLAQAFDGITLHEAGQTDPPKINNANFSTPTDGFNGRMQMFFWNNSGGAISIDAPENIKGFVDYGIAQFGKLIPLDTEAPVTGKVVLVNDGTNNAFLGCNPLKNGAEVSGNIAMIERGSCEFGRKAWRAQQAGAIAAIICNIPGADGPGSDGESAPGMLGGADGSKVTIPAIMLKRSDCEKIRIAIANGAVVNMTFQERGSKVRYLDGSLDNGIIAHEFGHGISTRLTGGRLNSSCLNNNEQMGEGWSDYFSLVMTHEPGDKGSDARGIGTFAAAETATGRGIRRFPYSTDMNVNPQTYKDIKGTTAPHPLGEVWNAILWDMYWNFIDKYGYKPDWNDQTSGNYKAVFLVMEGMKIQSCNPDFIKGRNAILKADSIHFAGANNKFLWETFARRGVGYFAKAGADRNGGTEDFEILPTLIEKLKITKEATSSVDPGKEVTVTINAINHIPSRQSKVIITDELPDGMTYVPGSGSMQPTVSGNLLTFDLGDMDYKKEVKITYKTQASLTNKSMQLAYENFDEEADWETTQEEGSEFWATSFDIFRSAEQSYAIFNSATDGDASLISDPFTVAGNFPALRFWHRYNTESGNDGGFIEVSVDGGEFVRIDRSKFFRNGYSAPLAYGTLAQPNIYAFSGNTGGDWTNTLEGPWVDSYIDLSEYKGKTLRFKFRFATNDTVKPTSPFAGWYIDDFELLDIYKYTAQACIASENGAGEKACTQAIETIVNSDGLVNTNDALENQFFTMDITPNPAADYAVVSVSAPVEGPATLSIVNVDGKVISQSPINISTVPSQKTIYTAGMVGGLYFVKVQNGNHVGIKKLVIR